MIKKMNSEDVAIHKNELYDLLQVDYVNTYGKEAEKDYVVSKLEMLPRYINENRAFVFGYYDDNIIHGFVWAYPVESPVGVIMHIAYVAVDLKCRNKGIGCELLNMVEQEARMAGLESIELIVGVNNDSARSFYCKNRFEEERIILTKKV